jgi:glycosyltransferase involved in cell wall biosynthesis
MKICFISEFFNPKYGGQYTSVKGITDICRLKKIKYIIIHKKSKIYSDKKSLEKSISKCDIIHIFGGWTLFYIKVSLLAHKLKKKVIVHPMGFYEPWSLDQKKIKKKLAWYLYQRKLLRQADLVHCASHNEEYNLKKLDSKIKTIILPFGISESSIKKTTSSKTQKRCIFLSRLHKKKGLDILIKAWVELKNKNWSLDIVGFGDKKYYMHLIKDIKNSKIRFLKPITDISKKNKLLDNYDFLVLPTLNENFGIAILESLARGLPVLTTNETPWIDIQNKNAGWVINYSLIELKLVLKQIFNTQDKEFFVKKKNAIKIAKKFTKENLAKLYLKTFKNVLSV